MADKTKPVLIALPDDAPDATPSEAPPVPEPSVPETMPPEGQAMQQAVAFATRRGSWLGRMFLALLISLAGFAASLWAWDFVNALIARSPILGGIAVTITGLLLLVLLLVFLREIVGFLRLSRLDRLQRRTTEARAGDDLAGAERVLGQLDSLYRGREELRWARSRLSERTRGQLEAGALLNLGETELMTPLDQIAAREIETATRQVATVTAIVPLAFADVIVALTANMRMINRIAAVYGGRAGVLGNWRLTRTVLAHLVATGAVAVGDDLIGSLAGGGLLSKVSRRFGEGVINGALTARVGVAAIEVCRPLPFHTLRRPSVTGLVQRALAGLFGRKAG